MKMKMIMAGALPALMAGWMTARAAEATSGPGFQEIYELLRANAVGVSAADLDRAAVQGMLNQYPALVTLVSNGVGTSEEKMASPLLSKTTLFDGAYAYLRVSRVAAGLADQIGSGYQGLSATNKLKGVILDLRYTGGDDYAAAAQAADKFLTTAQPLLTWGDQTARSTAKGGAIALPLMVLVNQQTSGAAEALAAVLRHTEAGLVIGSRTAGEAYVFKDFPLKDGAHLRIATTTVKVGANQNLLAEGLKPDIHVVVKPEDERIYYADAYKVLEKKVSVLFASSATNVAGGSATNAEPVHRPNEAELVRRQKEGLSADEALTPEQLSAQEAARPVVQDPVLARGLDLLKGLAVVQQQMRQP